MSRDVGGVGLAALGLLAGALLFLLLVLQPLEARKDLLKERLVARGNSAAAGSSVAQTAEKLGALYAFLETRDEPTQLLAKLHGAGAAAGVELRAAEYRLQKTGARIERYEITLPVTGTYAQIRSFIGRALSEIPALSLDQVNFRRQRVDDTQVQAEMRVTLHLVRQ
jgi:Tfp pilus assembly protein PilO